ELSFIDDPDPRLASCAATAAAAAISTSQGRFPSQRRTLIKSLQARARSTGSAAARAGALLDLGRLGEGLSGFLASHDWAIRLAAALGSADLSDPRALDILLDAARRPRELDTLLSPPGDSNPMTLPQLGGRPLSVVVAEETCARVEDLGSLVQPLVSATRSVGAPMGRLVARPYYRKLFPAGLPPVGIASGPQREVVRFLASCDEVWGQASLQRLLADLKLPVSQDEWQPL
ncbi:HEAT repeat domain-containing protein, partial [Streptomyces aureus]|uniref:HEAT repeat domain-containing protein n=1 Tax=Streptomyces aureus TaxID=193461 RepID=UPI0033FA535C